MRELENLLINDDNDNDNYYKPLLVKGYFKNNYKYCESRRDKGKKLSLKQYIYMIMPYLSDLINDHKDIRNESNEWKIQLNMSVDFISSNDTGEIRTFFVWSDNEEIRSGNKTDDFIKRLIKSFLTNYQNEEKTLRHGSNFVLESVD